MSSVRSLVVVFLFVLCSCARNHAATDVISRKGTPCAVAQVARVDGKTLIVQKPIGVAPANRNPGDGWWIYTSSSAAEKYILREMLEYDMLGFDSVPHLLFEDANGLIVEIKNGVATRTQEVVFNAIRIVR